MEELQHHSLFFTEDWQRGFDAIFPAGERRAAALLGTMRARLAAEPSVTVEYVAIVEPGTLEPVDTADAETVLALAARVGRTRLIDNIILGEGLGG